MSETTSMQRWALAAMLFNIIAWGMSWVNVRAVLSEVGAGQLGAMRYAIASAVMLCVWIHRGRPMPDRADWARIGWLGTFGFCLYNLCINFGEKTVGAGTGAILISCIPVMVLLLGIFTGRESVGGLTFAGMALSMTGVAITAAGAENGLEFGFGSLLILVAALCAAIQTLISRDLTRRYSAIDVTTWAIWVGTLGLLPFSEDIVGGFGSLSPEGWLHIMFLGMIPAALCYTIWSWVLVTLPITTVMSSLYGIPVFATLFGWIMLGEKPSAMTASGGLITLAGVAWVQSMTMRRPA